MSVLKPVYVAYEWYLSRNFEYDYMPKHIAVMMDGNRRYARFHGDMSPLDGHKHGRNTFEKFLGWCLDLKINIVTVYAFSSKNFNRPSNEVEGLMNLFKENFSGIINNEKIQTNEVRVKVVGQLDMLPDDVRETIDMAEKSTASNKNMLLNIAIGYDGRLEIINSIKKITEEVKEGKLNLEDIDEKIVNKNLYTAGLDDPDLLIRTSGEERFSGFLLWQSSYSELYFCDSYWPAFSKVDFLRALRTYQQRKINAEF